MEEFRKFKIKEDKQNKNAILFETEEGNLFYIEPNFYTQLIYVKDQFLSQYENILNRIEDIVKRNKKVIFTADFENPVVHKDDFVCNLDEPGCFLTKEGMKVFIKKLEEKLQTRTRYIQYVDYPVDFRRAIHLQVGQLVKAVEENDSSIYTPITIR